MGMTISKDFMDIMNTNIPYEEYDIDYEDWKKDNLDIIGIRCPQCNRAYNIIHFECSEYIDACSCSDNTKDTVYYCHECDVLWDYETDTCIENFSNSELQQTLFDDTADYNKTDPNIYDEAFQTALTSGKDLNKQTGGIATVTTTANQSWNYNYQKCSHKHEEIKLHDDTSIFCSSARAAETNVVPDFGLYADYIWSPKWRNEFIHWPDYGIPTEEDLGLTQIYEAYWRATQGEMVEIGCIGGHGRTGTILAIMHIASAEGEVTADEAIKFVRKKYCSHAIESPIQEWYIGYAASYWYGHELEDKPVASSSSGAGMCQMSDHFAMILRGHKECADKDSCKYWDMDLRAFNEEKHTAQAETALKNAQEKLNNYDYIYGGKEMLSTDSVEWPCDAYDHYAMIVQGHETECLRLGSQCKHWGSDIHEWKEHHTIIGNNEWDQTMLAQLFAIYPAVEGFNNE
jgi:hypothetical protein